MKKRSLLYKLIIINGIILGFILHFLAFILSLWFKGNFFDEKKTMFEDTGNYLSRAVKYYNDLSEKDKTVFENRVVSVADTEEANKKEILKYFLLLNRTGKVMDKKHLDKVE